MNQEVRRYAMRRMDDALTSRVNGLRGKHTRPSKKGPSDRNMVQAVRGGYVELRRGLSKTNVLDMTVREAFDFSDLEPENEFDKKGFDKDCKQLVAEANTIKDLVMRGTDDDVAWKRIEEFCKGC